MSVPGISGFSRLCYWFGLMLLPQLGLAQEDLPNTLDLYQTETPVQCRFALLDQDPAWIYAVLSFNQRVQDSIWITFSQMTEVSVLTDSILIKPRSQRQILKWNFEQGLPDALIVSISLNWQNRDWLFQEHFPLSALHNTGGVSLWQSSLPVLKSWIQLGDSVMIQSEVSDTVYVYYYSHQFEPARPPMAVRPGTGGGTLNIDTVFSLPANQFYTPDKLGLYFVQSDSSTTAGVSLLVADRYFPKPQEIADLTEPLIYISTKAEYQGIKEDLSSKQALDKFWLSTIGSPQRAKATISDFYQNIEDANTLFTSYKAGWKTDRGLIYSVMGPPLTVNKLLDGENWTYRDAAGEEIVFQFVKVSNIFSNNHYELFRDKSYDRLWFNAIDRWREGNNP